jgi:hypothetical protein
MTDIDRGITYAFLFHPEYIENVRALRDGVMRAYLENRGFWPERINETEMRAWFKVAHAFARGKADGFFCGRSQLSDDETDSVIRHYYRMGFDRGVHCALDGKYE